MTATTFARSDDAREAAASASLKRITRRVRWHILPILFISYCVSWLDRVNVGFTQLQMGHSIGIDPAQFGFAAGIFFLTYTTFEIPSNLIFVKLGARKTFLRIMLLWGLTVMATAFVKTPTQFYVARIMLGVFEAGFYPGVILFLTYWFPTSERGRVTAVVYLANATAAAIAGPICTYIMVRFDGFNNMHGWQWVFLLQGLPACLLGVACYFILADSPQQATWLSSEEKDELAAALERDRLPEVRSERSIATALLTDPTVWFFVFIYFSAACANFMFNFWMPTMLKEAGVAKLLDVGMLSTLPWVSGIVGLLSLNWSSDYFRERRWHLAFAFILAIIGFLGAVILKSSPVVLVACFCVANFGIMASGSLLWTMPPSHFSLRTAPAGIAMISTLGMVAGFVSPAALGFLRNSTGGYSLGISLITGLIAISLWLVIRVLPASAVRVGKARETAQVDLQSTNR